MNEDFLTLYRSNCRTPEVNLGDIQAMLAALQVGEKRVLELVAAHGVETVHAGAARPRRLCRRQGAAGAAADP